MKKSGLADLAQLTGLVTLPASQRTCPGCDRPLDQCVCAERAQAKAAGNAAVRVWLETKGRRGKGVTLIKGLPLDDDALLSLGKQLKANCGSGGTVKDGVIEIQGDHRDSVMSVLEQKGFKPKRAGG
jgi:translation initiation factor 1